MALKKIGVEKIEQDVYERICDYCLNPIPKDKYPKFELEVTHFEYNGDGTHPDSYDFCSVGCLKKFKIYGT